MRPSKNNLIFLSSVEIYCIFEYHLGLHFYQNVIEFA